MRSAVRTISWLVLLSFSTFTVSSAHAATLTSELPQTGSGTVHLASSMEEVSQADAEKIAPMTAELWDQYRKAAPQSGEMDSGNGGRQDFTQPSLLVGVIVLDVLVNLGAQIWSMILQGKARLDIKDNIATAIPQGIKDWTQLESWEEPVSKLYKTQLLNTNSKSLGDIYYRLIYTYGGKYQGKGDYLTNVTVIPAQINVPYGKNFFAYTTVLNLINHGTSTDPIAGMSLQLTWGIASYWSGRVTEQSVELHVRGDGSVKSLSDGSETPEVLQGSTPKSNR